jgi:putative endonuclease
MASTRPTTEFGRHGEDLARQFLEQLGYSYVGRNWHCRAGEIDLIMRDADEIVFVEVKTRHGEAGGRAEEAVSRGKSRKMLAAGEWYITKHPEFHDLFWRCDLVAITVNSNRPPNIAHFVNAIVVG